MNRFPFPPYRSGIPHWTERVVTYCAKVLPIVFDNSLSYYEFLGHVQVKLNEVIKALNSQNLVFVEFTHMIELELQNFEKYMEERQDNFEQQMQEEWQAFKTEMETAWNDFKTAMEQAWQEYKDEMDQAWADFQADMLQRFQTFQETITAQQTAFETRMEAVQQQFEDDMENRADTFEQTITDQQNAFEQNVETELEEWKDIAIRAILDTIRLELPDLISDIIGSDFLAPIITRQGFLKMISASNETATGNLDLTNEPISVFKNGEVSGISTLADLAAIQIEPGTAIMFTRNTLFSEISSGRFQYRASDFPASGYTLSVGVYVTDSQISTVFEDSKYSENTHIALDNGADGFITVTMGRTAWQDVTTTYQYATIVFQADPTETAFTCDYSTGVELAKPPTADMVLEDQATGKRYTVEQAQGVTVDQTYNAQSANAQSGTAVAQALGTIPSVTVDQVYDAQSANPQSGTAVAQAVSAIPTVTVDQTFDNDSTNAQSGAAITNAPIIPHWTTTSSWTSGSAAHSQEFNIFKDFPVGTLFLVKMEVPGYKSTFIIPLSHNSDTDLQFITYAPIFVSNTSLTPISSTNVNVVTGIKLRKSTNTNFVILEGSTYGSSNTTIEFTVSAIGVDQM